MATKVNDDILKRLESFSAIKHVETEMKPTFNLYRVKAAVKEVTIEVAGYLLDSKLAFAKGMVGVMPIFDTRENAKIYADNRYEIVKLTIVKKGE